MKIRILSLLLLFSLAVTVAPACSPSAEPAVEPEYAGPIVEAALQSISDGDYATHVVLFTQASQSQLTEAAFQQSHEFITAKVGTYVDKAFLEVKTESGYQVVNYQAQFSDEPAGVAVKAVFQEENGGMKLAGFWLDSPKLRG